jgi:hypothetical protein
MLNDQLPVLPVSEGSSSITYRLHAPFGDSPSKIERLTFPEGFGAGGGKMSLAG